MLLFLLKVTSYTSALCVTRITLEDARSPRMLQSSIRKPIKCVQSATKLLTNIRPRLVKKVSPNIKFIDLHLKIVE